MSRKSVLAMAVASLAVGALALEVPARADTTVKTGMMTCHEASGWGFVFGSTRSLRCTYAASGGGRVEHHTHPLISCET